MARAIFGIDPIDAGEIEIDGQPVRIVEPGAGDPRTGMALAAGGPQAAGTGPPALGGRQHRHGRAGEAVGAAGSRAAVAARLPPARRFIDALRIRTPGAPARRCLLSGGNQQKVVLAKWLLTEADIFIFDEPTRGIDVGAKVEVYRLMNELLARGAAIVMISSELPEVLGMSDRILVMRDGRIVAEFDARATATQEAVMSYAGGRRRERRRYERVIEVSTETAAGAATEVRLHVGAQHRHDLADAGTAGQPDRL